jgi:hypothetical protein
MKIVFTNGSYMQVIGSNNIDSIVGTNPVGVVFSEYSLQDPVAWGYVRPILAENGGWAIFVFTPRGENHGYDIWTLVKSEPGWYAQMDKASDTKVIPQDVLDSERREIVRLHSNDALYQQEFECNFSVPITGAYYAEHISKAYQDGRVTRVAHNPRYKVDTWWDLGKGDHNAIWFTQSVGTVVNVLRFVKGQGLGLPDYVRQLDDLAKSHGYVYGIHMGPHDIDSTEWSTGKCRIDTARSLGVNFSVCPKLPIMDGIDMGRMIFGRCWFDQEACADGLSALKSYHKEWDDKRKTFLSTPYHDWSSHGADAFRTLAVGLDWEQAGKPIVAEDKYQRAANRTRYDRSAVPLVI